jgi:hypothetical protein
MEQKEQSQEMAGGGGEGGLELGKDKILTETFL